VSSPYYQSAHWKALRLEALKRDHYRCTVPGCRHTAATAVMYVDHRTTRPNVPHPTGADVLGNLRTLCAHHDASVKEHASGARRGGGALVVKGCDASGQPLDPSHHWNQRARG
jgi:hypothetical protein